MKRALAPGTLALAVPRTQNAKLGDAAATYAAQASCPRGCVFFDGGGCYAETGVVGKFVTAPLNEAAGAASPVEVAKAEARAVERLGPDGRPLRLHVVGDCPTEECARIVAAACERYMDRGGGPVWGYTHAWREVPRAAWGRVSMLASCETPVQVQEARARGYATALVVERFEGDALYTDAAESGELPYGHKPGDSTHPRDAANGRGGGAPVTSAPILPCPAQTRDRSCTTCRLCFDDGALRQRGYSIGFAIHGIPLAQQRARTALRNPDDPGRRLSLETRLRQLVEHEPGIGATEAGRRLDANAGYVAQLLAYLRGEAKHPSVLRRERYDRKKVVA